MAYADIDETIRKKIDELLGNNDVKFDYKYVAKSSICSTCKYFDGKTCAKKRSFAGYATKLSDCDYEWEVCSG